MRGIERLYVMSVKNTDDCVEWDGAICHKYGIVRKGNKTVRAHREAFLNHNGFLPEVVRHKCDNPCCVNVRHLEAGTQLDNIQDTINRGRVSKGKSHGRPILPEEAVTEIRQNTTLNQTQLARKYNVHPSTISKILSNKARYHK